jgi:hypothetical protein
MKKYVFIILISLISMPVHSDESIKEAERFLELSGTKLVMDQMTEMMLAQELQNSPELVPFERILRDFFQKYLSYESSKNDLAKLYSEEFSKEELVILNEFYSTEVGQKSVKTIPRLMEKSNEMANKRVQENFAEFGQMVEEEIEKMNAQ